MDTGSKAGLAPATAAGDDDVLGDNEGSFECVYDAPHVVVNRIDGRLMAMVDVEPGNEVLTVLRIQAAVDVGWEQGELPYSMETGAEGFLLITFSPAGVEE